MLVEESTGNPTVIGSLAIIFLMIATAPIALSILVIYGLIYDLGRGLEETSRWFMFLHQKLLGE